MKSLKNRLSNLFHWRKPKTERNPEIHTIQCWGCRDQKVMIATEKTTDEEVVRFQNQWGPLDKQLRIIFWGDGTYGAERFCSRCQVLLNRIPKRQFGWLANEVAAELRDPEIRMD